MNDDLISRSALLAALVEGGILPAMVRRTIENAPAADAETVHEWVSVKDRLPERDKEVLLIVHGWEDRLYYTGCLHRQEAERSWLTGIESKASDWMIWGFSYLREPIVTHWMPLPEPPEAEAALEEVTMDDQRGSC